LLIVDDSPAMRVFISRVIRLSGFEPDVCFAAANGAEALDLLRTEPVDLILSDINMPVMDGEEFLGRLAADPDLRSIPLVVISTDATANRIARMLALGARGYVTKPFLPETMRSELDRILECACE
jgi:two-component system chemotaxis response regulator CheY